MRVFILAAKKTAEVGASYGRRLIEQGKAVLAPPAKKAETRAAKSKKE